MSLKWFKMSNKKPNKNEDIIVHYLWKEKYICRTGVWDAASRANYHRYKKEMKKLYWAKMNFPQQGKNTKKLFIQNRFEILDV